MRSTTAQVSLVILLSSPEYRATLPEQMCHDRAAAKSNFHHQSASLSPNKWGSVCFSCAMAGCLDADIVSNRNEKQLRQKTKMFFGIKSAMIALMMTWIFLLS